MAAVGDVSARWAALCCAPSPAAGSRSVAIGQDCDGGELVADGQALAAAVRAVDPAAAAYRDGQLASAYLGCPDSDLEASLPAGPPAWPADPDRPGTTAPGHDSPSPPGGAVVQVEVRVIQESSTGATCSRLHPDAAAPPAIDPSESDPRPSQRPSQRPVRPPADLRQWVSGSRPSDAGQASADSDEAGLNAGQAVDRVLADLEPAGVALAALAPPDVWP
jgi:hypothetical protein